MKRLLLLFYWPFSVAFVLPAVAQSLSIELQSGTLLRQDRAVRWQIVLSNATPTAIHFSDFSLANLVRATKFKDEQGRSWQITVPRDLIHPAQPEIDYKRGVAGHGIALLTVRADQLELISTNTTRVGNETNTLPSRLQFGIAGELSVSIDASRKIERWQCSGKGNVEIKERFP